MASKQFFDPMALLRVAPLVTSTVAMQYSVDQHLFLNNFLAIKQETKTEAVVHPYFRRFFIRGFVVLAPAYTLSIAVGFINFYLRPNDFKSWYACGTAFALAHFAFVPKIMWKVEALTNEDNEVKHQGLEYLKDWLEIHAVRSLLVDFPAWLCFSLAALKSFRAE
jgi:hypothetical protein